MATDVGPDATTSAQDARQRDVVVEVPVPASNRTVLWTLLSISIVLVVVSLALAVARYELDIDDARRLQRWFDVDEEATLPAWYSSALLLLCALTVASINRVLSPDARSRYWTVLAWFLVVMSADEAVAVHEKVGEEIDQVLDLGGPLKYAWVIPGAAIVVVMAVLSRSAFRALPRRPARTMALGVVLFLAGAIGFELLDATLTEMGTSRMVRAVEACGEELLEMLGVSVFLYGTLLLVARRRRDEIAARTDFSPPP